MTTPDPTSRSTPNSSLDPAADTAVGRPQAFAGTWLSWRHRPGALALTVAGLDVPVPADIAERLATMLTDDPATDLLMLEQRLRLTTAVAADSASRAHLVLRSAEATARGRGWRARRAHRRELAALGARHALQVDRHQAARTAVTALRQWIVDVHVRDGLLASASAGWLRSPDPPDWVIRYADEQEWLDHDPRRTLPAWWTGHDTGTVIVGREWRRDGDDDPTADRLSLSGPWWLCVSSSTGEVYTTRRSTHAPEAVWLLARAIDDLPAVLALLASAQAQMRQPNSVLLAADVVHEHAGKRAAQR